jgi:hypothetical protein
MAPGIDWDEVTRKQAEAEPAPLDTAVKLLDRVLSGQDRTIWLAWCSVRTQLRDSVKLIP